MTFHTNLHLVLRFWNQVLTCASVILRLFARAARSALARYFCRWKRFSNSHIWTLEKEVRGFFRLGGVRFWYGCPILRVTANGTRAAAGRRDGETAINMRWDFIQQQTDDFCVESQGQISQKSALCDNSALFMRCICEIWWFILYLLSKLNLSKSWNKAIINSE